MQNIDFNDVLVQKGVQAVREQLAACIAPDAPVLLPITDTTPSFSESLKAALRRFRQIIDGGKVTNKVFDTEARLEMTKTQFTNKVGKKVVQAWFEHDVQYIDRADVDAMQQKATDKSIEHLLDRYYYISGTEEVWDAYKLCRVKITSVRHDDPNNYDHWYKSLQRKKIEPENIWFDPTGDRRPTDDTLYANSYRGLAIEPSEMTHEQAAKIAKPIIDLLAHLCNGNLDDVDWALNWIAMPLQKPGTKMRTALIFHGKTQGAGKSLFFGDVMSAIYGDYSVTLQQSQLEGAYNDWVDGKLWAVFEEIFAGNDRYRNTNMVKQLTTGTTIYINKKFMSGWSQENHVNCIFLSNDVMPLAIQADDRRMFVVCPKFKCPTDLSDTIGDALRDPNKTMLKAFLQFLLTKDIGKQNPFEAAPMTPAKERLIDVAATSTESYIKEWMSGLLRAPFATCLAQDLFNDYKRWCIQGNRHSTDISKFTAAIYSHNGISSHRCRYRDRSGKRTPNPQTFIVVGEMPKSDIEQYFSKCYKDFHDTMTDQSHQFTNPVQPYTSSFTK